jgi:hypothetical protein
MAMLPTMLAQDRQRAGWSVGQAAWRLGLTVREYRELEARRALAERGDVQPNLQAVRLAADVRRRSEVIVTMLTQALEESSAGWLIPLVIALAVALGFIWLVNIKHKYHPDNPRNPLRRNDRVDDNDAGDDDGDA